MRVGRRDNTNWCAKNAPPAREPAAYLWFGLLFACVQHGIKSMLQVTRGLNVVDEIEDALRSQHGSAGGAQMRAQ